MALELQSQSQNISLLAINGSSFLPGGKVIWEIPADLGFIRASRGESYLAFELKNTGSARWMLATSGQCLIDRVDIFSMDTGQQIESLQNYGQVQWHLDQYSSVSHGMVQSTEGMRKDVTSLQTFGNGATGPRLNSSDGQPESVMNSVFSPIVSESGVKVSQPWKILVPLRAGVFGSYSDEKLTPLMAFGGLRVEITLQSEALSLTPLCPIVDAEVRRIVNPVGEYTVTQGGNTSTLIIAGSDAQSCGIFPGDSIYVVATGLAIQTVRVTSVTTVGSTVSLVVDKASDVSGGDGNVLLGIQCSNGGAGLTATLADTTVETCGLSVGQSVTLSDTAVSQERVITALSNVGDDVTLTYAGNVDLSAGRASCYVTPDQWTSGAKYSVESLEYRIQQIMPPKNVVDSVLKPGFMYKFRTWDVFFDSIPASSRRHQLEIPSVSSMAKCIMSHYSSSTHEENPNMQQYYYGMTPDDLKMNSLQYFINNKLFPLRAYDPRRTKDRPQQYNEMQKAFSSMGSGAFSFGDASGSNLDGYSNTFLSCRELARGRYVYSLRDAEPSVRLAFTGSRDEIVRVNTYVWSDRVVSSGPGGFSVIL